MSYALFKYFEKNGQHRECVAPTQWIKESKLYWPKYAARQLALEMAPLDETWPSYPIHEIKKYHDDYNYLNDCCYTTTEDESPVKKKTDESPKRASSPHFNISGSYANSFSRPTLPGACRTQSQVQSPTVSMKRKRDDTIVRSSFSPAATCTESNSFIPLASIINADNSFNPDECISPYDLLDKSGSASHSQSPRQSPNCARNNGAMKKKHANFIVPETNDQRPSTQKKCHSKYGDGGKDFKEMSNKQYQYSVMMELQVLKRYLAILENQETSTSEQTLEPPEPLDTMEEFDIEEEKLKAHDKRVIKRKMIKQIGGKDIRQAIRLALDSMMSRRLQSKFSKSGLQKKRKFKGTYHYKCLEAVLLLKYEQFDIDKEVGDIIKRANDKPKNAGTDDGNQSDHENSLIS